VPQPEDGQFKAQSSPRSEYKMVNRLN